MDIKKSFLKNFMIISKYIFYPNQEWNPEPFDYLQGSTLHHLDSSTMRDKEILLLFLLWF